jgi:hypothetical protein
LHDCERYASDIEATENNFVVSGKPEGKVDVEVVAAINGVSLGQSREGAPKPIENQHKHFDKDSDGTPYCSLICRERRSHWNCQDACCKKYPDDGMHCLDYFKGKSAGIGIYILWHDGIRSSFPIHKLANLQRTAKQPVQQATE